MRNFVEFVRLLTIIIKRFKMNFATKFVTKCKCLLRAKIICYIIIYKISVSSNLYLYHITKALLWTISIYKDIIKMLYTCFTLCSNHSGAFRNTSKCLSQISTSTNEWSIKFIFINMMSLISGRQYLMK